MLGAGVALGLAQLCKTTWIVLFVLWPVVCLFVGRAWPRRRWLQFGGILAISLYLINLGYGFEGSLRRVGDYQFLSAALSGTTSASAKTPDNRFRGSAIALVPLPLPADYVQGIDQTRWEFEMKKWSYFIGEWRRGGWPHFYIVALMLKVPLGIWVLIATAGLLRLHSRSLLTTAVDDLLLVATPAAILLFVSSQTGFNHHLRYVLMCLPFLFVWASVNLGRWPHSTACKGLVAVSLTWTMTALESVCLPFQAIPRRPAAPPHSQWFCSHNRPAAFLSVFRVTT